MLERCAAVSCALYNTVRIMWCIEELTRVPGNGLISRAGDEQERQDPVFKKFSACMPTTKAANANMTLKP